MAPWGKKPAAPVQPPPPPPPPAPSSPGELAQQVAHVLGPVLLVVLGMAAVSWLSGLVFRGKSREGFLALYFAAAVAVAAQLLVASGDAAEAWRMLSALPASARCAVGALLSSLSYAASRAVFASGGAGDGDAAAADWEGDAKGSFAAICDGLIEEALEELKTGYDAIPEQLQWVRAMLEYNVKGGKASHRLKLAVPSHRDAPSAARPMNRGLGVIDVQKAFATKSGRTLSNLEHCRAAVLGWCIEWLQAFFLVADDVMDDSHTRRGQPCWYRVPHVKQIAINDAFILESLVYRVLRRHFSQESYYLQLVELFHDVTYRTEMGQLLDLTSQPLDKPPDFARFTATRYAMIVKYKTAFYTFYLPCAIGMIYASVSDPSSFALARRICCIIGEYFQIQDDYLDCYGDPAVIGKVGTDIQDMKCSWLVVQALEKCTPEQRQQLMDNYGKNDPKKIAKVKALYTALGLPAAYRNYEEQSHGEIQTLIAEVKDVPTDVYNNFVKRIYKRDK
ncbi:farnesyl pyrophosphate synthase, partial [Tribonema minus]